jgi:hypothetical protein
VAAKIEVRVEKGEDKGRAVKERKKEWSRLNKGVLREVGESVGEKVVGGKRLKELDEELDGVIPAAYTEGVEEEWEDEIEGDRDMGGDSNIPGETVLIPILQHRPPAEIALPAEGDEIL